MKSHMFKDLPNLYDIEVFLLFYHMIWLTVSVYLCHKWPQYLNGWLFIGVLTTMPYQ